MTLSDIKDKWHSVLDKWDAFKASPTKTHLAVFACGIVVGVALVFKHA